MRKLLFAFTFAALLGASAALAQDAAAPADEGNANGNVEKLPAKERAATPRRDVQPSLTAPTTTPEMWFYEQERKRYEDPKAAVRRNAEYRMVQRQRRIESRKWYGLSNSRPVATPDPWYGTYSPMWGGSNFDPHLWSGVGPGVAFRPGWYGTETY